MKIVPSTEWVDLSHRLIHHGRRVCLARRPRCEICSLESICPKIGVGGPRWSEEIHEGQKRSRPRRPIRLDLALMPRVF